MVICQELLKPTNRTPIARTETSVHRISKSVLGYNTKCKISDFN